MGATSGQRTFTGVQAGAAAPGAVVVAGATVGDIVAGVYGVVTATALGLAVPEGQFEQRVTVAGQVQQIVAGDLSLNTYHFQLITRA